MNLFEQLPLFRLLAPTAEDSDKPRYVQLGSRIVAYQLRLGKRRPLSLTIDERGLRVGAPLRAPLKEIEAFIGANSACVHKKLEEYAVHHARRHIAVRDGARLPLLGGEIGVRIVIGGNRIYWEGDELVLAARAGADFEALARRGLQRRALADFAARIARYAPLLGREAPPLRLSSARTRWGSCSAKSGISLNWRLIHLAPALIDYVVVHELSHLLEMNHSPRFWAVVERLCPDWREQRRALKECAAQIPIL